MTIKNSNFLDNSIWLGVFDALTARLAEMAETDALWLSSLCVSVAAKACPDASILTSTEMIDLARYLSSVTTVPLIVDCDSGYGDPTKLGYTVQQYCKTSTVAGICIEDKRFPKRNSFYSNNLQELEDITYFCELIEAAHNVRRAYRSELKIIGRTEALVLGAGVNEAILRMRRFVDSGVDAILVQAKGPIVELLEVATRWKEISSIPLICVPTVYPDFDSNYFFENGFDVVVYANQLLRASVLAMESYVKNLLVNKVCTTKLEKDIIAMKDLNKYVSPNFQLHGTKHTTNSLFDCSVTAENSQLEEDMRLFQK